MRSGGIHITLFIFFTLLLACDKQSHPPNTKSELENANHNNGKLRTVQIEEFPVLSRFQLDSNTDVHEIRPLANPSFIDDIYHINEEPVSTLEVIKRGISVNFKKNNYEKTMDVIKHGPSVPLSHPRPSKISSNVYFIAIFDNDIFDYTDYYYTNGIMLELYHPVIASSLISSILPGLKHSMNYFSVSLTQNLYTPLKLEDLEPRLGDRPFASFLTFGHKRISLLPQARRKLQSECILGILGPASMGRVAQDLIHQHEPVGWINQVGNDFIFNYNIRYEQSIYSNKYLDINWIAECQAGTLYDNIMAGASLRFGNANSYFEDIFQTSFKQNPYRKRVRYFIGLEVKNKIIMYDATMQGGMFNKENAYSLNANMVNNHVFAAIANIGVGLGKYSLEAEQVFLTPEFKGGRHHLWFRIKNVIQLN